MDFKDLLNETGNVPVTCKHIKGVSYFNKLPCPDIASYITQSEELKMSPFDWLILELENTGLFINEKTKADIFAYLKTHVRGEGQ